MNKIIKIISPIKKLPEKTMEHIFNEYIEKFFLEFRKKLQCYGEMKQWTKETYISETPKENKFSKANLMIQNQETRKEFFQIMLDNPWMIEEFRSMHL
jgi:hypothetical protein